MEHLFFIATIWIGFAIFAAIIAYHLRISIALIEICLGVIVAALATFF